MSCLSPPSESTSFAASYAAPITLLNAIIATCAQYRRAQTLVLAKELADEHARASAGTPLEAAASDPGSGLALLQLECF